MFRVPPQGPPNPYPARDGEKGQVGDPGRMGQDGAPGLVGPRGDYGDTPEELKVFINNVANWPKFRPSSAKKGHFHRN
jgi:hypothetical protein